MPNVWRHYLIGPEPYPGQAFRRFYAPNLDQAFAAARSHWPTKTLTFLRCEEGGTYQQTKRREAITTREQAAFGFQQIREGPYLTGDEPLGRFVCVTKNWSSHGEEKLFFLPVFSSLRLAKARAEEYCDDDIFEEIPVKIVDLDTGYRWIARPVYEWNKKGPQAVDQEAAS